jgi:hypothetical protein
MRFKILPTLLIAIAAIFSITSCSKSNIQGRYIPASAAVVVHVNGESLTAKLPWEEVKQNELFKTIYADSALSGFAKSALDNPENTGIDIKKDLIFFMVKDSAGAYIVFEGTIKDAAKFKTYNTAALKNPVASEKNGVEYLSTERTTVSWDKTKFIVVADAPEVNQMKKWDKWMNKDSMQFPQAAKSTRNGVATASLLYELTEGNSLAKNEKFSELLNTKGDIHFWANAEALNAGSEGIAALSMINLNKFYEGSYSTGTVNFENGKIDVDMKSYAGKEMTNIWKKYSGSKISSDMAKRLPAKEVALFFALNFKPEGIKELVKLTGMEGLINMGSAFLGFNLDDFVKANKGDILLAISDISKDSTGKLDAAVLFSASVGDKASFDKLINAGNKMGKTALGTDAPKISYNSNDKYFAIGNKKENIDQFITKEGSSKFDFFDKIASSPIGGYINLQYIMKALRDETSKDSLGLLALDASLKIWDYVIISGGEFKNAGLNQHIEINLLDKTTNSLKQLNNYIAEMGKIAKEKKKESSFNWIEETPKEDTLLKQ